MRFVRSELPVAAADHLVRSITAKLNSGKRVFLLLSGGSAVSVATIMAERLRAAASLRQLTVTLMDERYGPVGHKDSNWQQLLNAGFSLPSATLLPVLHGNDISETAKAFGQEAVARLEAASYRIGLFGIGPDGHTAGILPHTSSVHESGMVHAYDAGGYQRITLTAAALTWLDEAVVYAVGQPKHHALGLLKTNLSVQDQPAQLLKAIPNVTIYNDYMEETI